jgi:formylglycine-generating enzyme required for sulfatase activity
MDSIALMERPQQSTPPNMAWIPSGTFRMGSNKHYPEDALVHRVTEGGFWIDRALFRKIRAAVANTTATIPCQPTIKIPAQGGQRLPAFVRAQLHLALSAGRAPHVAGRYVNHHVGFRCVIRGLDNG